MIANVNVNANDNDNENACLPPERWLNKLGLQIDLESGLKALDAPLVTPA
jgi:hypothetical protein